MSSEQRDKEGLSPWSYVGFFPPHYERQELDTLCAWMVGGHITPLVYDSHLWLSLVVELRNPIYPFTCCCGNSGNMDADFIFTTKKCSFKKIKKSSWYG